MEQANSPFVENPLISRKRDTFSPPIYVSDVKHKNMIRKFGVVARKMNELQVATTWSDEKDQIEKPQCHFCMFAYDELVLQPSKRAQYDRIESYRRRKGGQFFFSVPDGFDVAKFGKKFEEIGKEMQQGSRSFGTNWRITKNTEEFHRMLYGDAKFESQGNNKQAKTRNGKKKESTHKRKRNHNNENGDTKFCSKDDNEEPKIRISERKEIDESEDSDGFV